MTAPVSRSFSRTFFAARFLACLLPIASGSPAFSQAAMAKPAPAGDATAVHIPPAEDYGKLLSLIESEFVSAAEAMPEQDWDFAPPAGSGSFDGVRTFGQQVKHVAGANYFFFADPGTAEAATKARQDEIEKLTSKADIVKALKESLVQAHKYVAALTTANATLKSGWGTRGSMAAFGMAHMMDHYGQMAVYLRMNKIVPPASQKR